MTMTTNQPIHHLDLANPPTRPRNGHTRRPLALAILMVVVSQAIVTAGLVIGGDPLLGVFGAAMITICGLTLIFAAAQA